MSTKRSKIEIIYDMLNAISEKRGSIKPTHLLYKSNLSHNKMKEYLTELVKKDMISENEEEGKKSYLITEKGTEFLTEFRRIKKFSESFGI
jgi:predicted transcriptional regulator